jgi:hypothetical protein
VGGTRRNRSAACTFLGGTGCWRGVKRLGRRGHSPRALMGSTGGACRRRRLRRLGIHPARASGPGCAGTGRSAVVRPRRAGGRTTSASMGSTGALGRSTSAARPRAARPRAAVGR